MYDQQKNLDIPSPLTEAEFPLIQAHSAKLSSLYHILLGFRCWITFQEQLWYLKYIHTKLETWYRSPSITFSNCSSC